MSKQCVSLPLHLVSAAEEIKSILTTTDDVDQLHDKIRKAKQTLNLSEKDFSKCLLYFDLNPEEFTSGVKTASKLNSSLAIRALDYDNFQSIFAGATSAWAWTTHFFKANLFKYAFVNTDTNIPDKKLISSGKQDFNLRIVQFKNFLFKTICENLGITELRWGSKIFTNADLKKGPFSPLTAKVNIDLYQALMSDGRVSALVNTMLGGTIRSNPMANASMFDAFSALFILNNFDQCIGGANNVQHGDFDKLVKLDPELKGSLQNVNYQFEPEGTEPDNWTSHTVENSGAEKYSSSLGKFILAQIPMLDSQGNPIPGRFMSQQDAFVVSAILKDLEMEYFLAHPDQKVSLRNGGKKALRTLLQNGTNLKSFSRHKQRLAPIIRFLYESDKERYSIKEATRRAQVATQNVFLLDVESVLAFELIKQYSPAYLEYTTTEKDALGRDSNYVVRAINNGKTYRVTDGIKQQVVNHLSALAEMSKQHIPTILKQDGSITALLKEKVSDDDILYAIKYPDSAKDEVKELLELFEGMFQAPLSEDLLIDLAGIHKIYDSLHKVLAVLDQAKTVFKIVTKNQKSDFIIAFDEALSKGLFSTNEFTKLSLTLKEAVSDIPVINFTSARKTQIPVYKINSAIADDLNYIIRYKEGNNARKSMNVFVAYPQLLSNVNKTIGDGEFDYNENYPGATGVKLETIVPSGSNPNSKGSAAEASKNSFLGDYLGLTHTCHTMAVQVLPYSDKSTAFTKNINLDVEITVGDITTTLLEASNDQITRFYFEFERNKRIDIVCKILNDWKKLFNLNIDIPTIDDVLFYPDGQQFKKLLDAWKFVDKYLTDHQIKESNIRQLIASKQKSGDFEIVEDLHYRQYSDTPFLSLNNTLFAQLRLVRDFATFKKFHQNKAVEFMLQDATQQALMILGTPEYQHLTKGVFANYTIEEIIYRYIILTNFVKDQYLDLNFKGVYLDKIKKFPKPDLEADEAIQEEVAYLEESYNLKAGSKRTVAMGGTGTFYQLDRIDGVSTLIKSCIFQEPKEQAFSPFGKSTGVEIFNGAGYTSPIFSRQQTASLPGEGFDGLNRKTLGMAVNDYRSTLYKWAEYPMTNWHMRVSGGSKFRMEYVFKLMHDLSWDENGRGLDIDLTKNLFGTNLTPQQANGGQSVYFSKGSTHYHLTSITKVGRNIYKINAVPVNSFGEALADTAIPATLYSDLVVTDPELNPTGDPTIVKIESLYELWKVFGGAESETLSPTSGLLPSESSLDMLYYYVTNVGRIKETDEELELIQSNVEQPLRNYFVSIAASDSGVKRAVGNRNSNNIWYEESKNRGDVILLTTTIQANDISKSLDASHELEDDDDIKEQTQTASTISTLGHNIPTVDEVYNAMNLIIQDGIKDLNKQLSTLQRGNVEQTIRQMSVEIVESIKKDKDINALTPIIEIVEKGLGHILPPSSPMFFRSMVKKVIQDLNQNALIRRYPGSADVLNPTSNIVQVYTINGINKTREELIRDARRTFEHIPACRDLTTDELIKLYIYSQGYDYKEDMSGSELLKSLGFDIDIVTSTNPLEGEIVTSASTMLGAMDQTLIKSILVDLKQLPTNTDQIEVTEKNAELKWAFEDLAHAYKIGTLKINDFTSISPLTPIYYRLADHKDGEYIRTTLNTIKDYMNFMWAVRDGKVTEVYLDLLTPHDLKMQSVSYTTSKGKKENLMANVSVMTLNATLNLFAARNQQIKEEAKAKETSENNRKNCL